MARTTMSKHAPGEPDWRLPVPDTWSRAATITVPLLAINGDLDSADHIGMAERLARTVAHGHATTIKGAAHYPNMERPDAFCQSLTDFLRTLATPPDSNPPAAPQSPTSSATAAYQNGPDRPAGFPADVCVTMRAPLVPVSRLSSTSPRAAGISPP
jgi:hypothetical protein